MTKKITILVLICTFAQIIRAQNSETKPYTNFPLIITLQFHAFTLPFRDVKANFSNIGIGIGTEWKLSKEANWVQQLNILWYHNKALGNGIATYTQATWRPGLGQDGFAEVKAGAGYLYSFRPNEALYQKGERWMSTRHHGKGMLTIPIGVSLGFNLRNTQSQISNFISYQFLPVVGYNKSIPLVPMTLIQVGSRIHF